MLLLGWSGSAWGQAGDPQIYVFAKAREPQFFYYVDSNPCRRRENWTEQQGCIAWVRGLISRNRLLLYPLGSLSLDLDETVFLIPVCNNAVQWRNAVYDMARQGIHRTEVSCR